MFDIEAYISEKVKNTDGDIKYLDKIAAKIDLKKVLYQFYDGNIKMIETKVEVSDETYNDLFDVLSNSNDYKLINSAFKLNDLLLDKRIIKTTEHIENTEKLKKKIKIIIGYD